jgi:hypothetical protein
VSIDLRPLHARLRNAVESYASLLLSTLWDGEDDWAKAVLAALRPLLVARQLAPRVVGADLDASLDAVDAGPVAEIDVVVPSE